MASITRLRRLFSARCSGEAVKSGGYGGQAVKIAVGAQLTKPWIVM